MKIHFNEFRGGLDHQVATFDKLRSRICELLEEAHQITPGEKTTSYATVARAQAKKDEVVLEKKNRGYPGGWHYQRRLSQGNYTSGLSYQRTEAEKDLQASYNKTMKQNSTLGQEVILTHKVLEEWNNEVAQLSRIIRDIE